MAKMAEFHIDDIIEVTCGDVLKKYDKVSRIKAKNQDGDVDMLLDMNTEIYPIHKDEKLRMVLSQTLNLDGSAMTNYSPKEKQISLADKFDCVMHGLVYKISGDTSASDSLESKDKVEIYISFGGLQLMLKGSPLKMQKFKVGQKLFLLLRKN